MYLIHSFLSVFRVAMQRIVEGKKRREAKMLKQGWQTGCQHALMLKTLFSSF